MQGELKQVADLALFAKIVQTGGISRCAADLGLERTTISRRLGSLEQTLGVKLLDRTPKHIAVTDAGRRCLEQCEILLESAANAQSLATIGAIITNKAPIVVGAPPDIIDRYLEPRFGSFESENPGVRIDRKPVTVWTEDAVESVDIGIALAPVTIASGWTNTIACIRQSIFAGIDYAAQHEPVRSPADLERHDCIVEASDRETHSWRFGRGDSVTTVSLRPKYTVSGLLEAREATLAGLGIARLPQYMCEPYLRSGRLVDLTPDIESAGREVIVISPRQRQRKTGTAALRMHLESAFKNQVF
ncbi:MAG: LysR family transcriptional regulator [Gammaproteobacteria bacterium]|jgi:DNA-binding transcriptional LysR family regulator|nr:LysR family transcriptional regulator [Gammaproteobacteria bacterium]